MDLTKELEAARIILTEGIGGANKAAMLVPLKTVLALLILQHYKEEGADNEEILKTLKHSGLTQIAEIGYGRCAIWDMDIPRLVAAFEVRHKEAGEAFCVSIPVAGLNVPMWMGGVQQRFFARNAPYTEIQELLLTRDRQFKIEHGLSQT